MSFSFYFYEAGKTHLNIHYTNHTALEGYQNYSDRRGLLSGVVYEFVLGYEFIHPECTYSATQNISTVPD